jgi:hypothetical protein
MPAQRSSMSHSPTAGRHTVEAGTAAQVPTDPVSAHESQIPALHGVLQHTPSTQLPLTQRLDAPHGWPVTILGIHTPAAQKCVVAQFASVEQPPAQTLPSHSDPGQFCVIGLGQGAELPLQLVASVATPDAQLAARHSKLDALNPSVGQASPVPVQRSSRSQGPATARQGNVAGRLASVGHAAELPVHVSARSQGPAAARHDAPAFPGV